MNSIPGSRGSNSIPSCVSDSSIYTGLGLIVFVMFAILVLVFCFEGLRFGTDDSGRGLIRVVTASESLSPGFGKEIVRKMRSVSEMEVGCKLCTAGNVDVLSNATSDDAVVP